MKINKRNLLTALLALLCTIALAFGVSFAMPKVEKISADAATVSVVPTVSFTDFKFYGDSNYSNASINSSDFYSVPACVTYSSDSTSVAISTTHGSGFYQNSVVSVQITLSITVPAYTIYSVEYETSFSISGTYGRSVGIFNEWETASGKSFVYNGALTAAQTTNPDMSGALWTWAWGDHPSGNTVLFYNDTNTSKNISIYNYLIYHRLDNSSEIYASKFSFDNFKVEATNIALPTTTETPVVYDGNAQTFDFTHDQQVTDSYQKFIYNGSVAKVKESDPLDYLSVYKNITTTIEAKDYVGDTIVSSTYSLSAEAVNRTLTATEAGTYTLKFNLTADAKANGIEWSTGGTGEKSLTFTIKRKGVAVPTVLNSTQTYKAAEYEFGLSGYDSDIMSVPSGGYTSNVTGATITWDNTAGSEKFKATDAATYTVKFHMDSPNHIWTTDSGESSSDQSKTITINKKEISITTTPAANSSPSWGLGDTASIDITATASGITNPDFVLNIYYIKGTDTANPLDKGLSGMTLDVSQIESSGEYKLCIELTSATANKN
ncbi:MAG: hypothetical protein K2N52_00225, partial [Clostridia bacterium]|nr:hypothetical protein [Clostridia bacterium]